ncbi:hypothetical protein Hypma_000681 [Hypsizygus marmoreus]|uniref:Zn(2)-C6 fungal-type domain-containing protein n=1 Tax=Hypsizygus marmoreus TaxID=39966 RepID=A0A369J7M8_HYPMA|nr:hypothetical protein Hypma_000681 [Hypsizygus marmoreus]
MTIRSDLASARSSHSYSVSSLNDALAPEYMSAERHSSSRPAFPQSHTRELVVPSQAPHHSRSHKIRPEFPRRDSGPLIIDTYNLGADRHLMAQSPQSIARSEHPEDRDASPASARPRKPRREKPRIELAPDQPPTTQGKPRARVYVACLQCRTRKIRCDGAKPICYNCSKRATASSECNYDPIPKRRGPDKIPGARQRSAKDTRDDDDGTTARRRRRQHDPTVSGAPPPDEQADDSPLTPCRRSRSNSGSFGYPSVSSLTPTGGDIALPPLEFAQKTGGIDTAESPYLQENSHSHNPQQSRGLLDPNHLGNSLPLVYDDAFDLSTIIPLVHFPSSRDNPHGYICSLENDGNEEEDIPRISCEPSISFSRKIWWDSLLSLYISPGSDRLQTLTSSQREVAAQGITSDIRFLFSASNYWFSFFHIPTFFRDYFDTRKRERIQPSLVLALLAMSTFWQSSEQGLGAHGRERALRFRDEAQSALDASFNAGWIDETLAQAAWLLALFEVCAHPLHSSERSNSSMVMLDSIIRGLSLTFVDADDPNASTFSPGAVPAVLESSRKDSWHPDPALRDHRKPHIHQSQSRHGVAAEVGCACKSMTLVEHWPECNELTPLWTSTPAWPSGWSEAEIRKESCRRLSWSAMILAAGHAAYTTAHKSNALNLFISDPANYALLFSGESIAYSPTLSSNYSSKDTIWALHDRSFLLWHACIRMRSDSRASGEAKAQFAMKTWLEADAIEAALNKHTCGIERTSIFQAREYIFNTRMCITYEFRRYIPLVRADISGLFHREKAEEWLRHQATVAERFMLGLHTITGNSNNLLVRRPFFVFWFMGQISRSLSLWECDNTLTVALDVCKALVPPLDYLTALWPCPEQRYRYDTLRERLANACYAAGVNPPPPTNRNLTVLS